MMRTLAATLLLASMGLSGAHAACDIESLTVRGARLNADYDPFSSNISELPITLAVRGGEECLGAQIEIAAEPQSIADTDGETLQIGIGRERLRARIVDVRNRSLLARSSADPFGFVQPITRFLRDDQLIDVSQLALNVAPGQSLPPGEYATRVTFRARARTDDGAVGRSASAETDITLRVRPVVRVAPPGRSEINLGELSPGEVSAPTRFTAYANVSYNLLIRSQNGWLLQRTGAPGGVAYQLILDRTRAQDRSGDAFSRTFPRPTDVRRRHDLQVEITDLEDQPAGEYSDWVTVEITPQFFGD